MTIKALAILVAIGSLSCASTNAHTAEDPASTRVVDLSADLLDLLRAEMREIAGGVQGIGLSLAAADWDSIQQTSAKIRASYIMEKSLTPAQAAELERGLPAQFKQLDAEFHQRADKLGAAAAAHDSELVAVHYSRLLESCARCHAAYARSRFPGFASPGPASQDH